MTSSLLRKMQSGEPALGVGLRQARTVDIGRAMVTAGADFLYIDMEHNSMTLDTGVQISVAAQDAGITPLVRVPKNDFALACRMLDGGAMGIVMPRVDNAEEAAAFAQECRYPPQGRRSMFPGLPQLGFRSVPLGDAIAEVEPQILLFPIIESESGARHVNEIVATPGLDGVIVGMGDLSIDLGVPAETGHPRVRRVVDDCIAACRAQGKWIGFGGVGDIATNKEYTALGMNFVIIGNDLGLLISAVAARVQALRPPPPPATAFA